MEANTNLYSQKAIGLATYLGGPLAAGILIRKNYVNLGKERLGLNALIISAVSTGLLFWGLFSIPEHIIDKIPNYVIPLVYAGIIYVIVERIQGKELKDFKDNNGEFYSRWRAFGVGMITGVIIFGGIFGYILLQEDDWDVDAYNAKIDIHASNETDAMKLFDIIDSSPKSQTVRFIKDTGIPKWQENLQVLNSIGEIENVPEEYEAQVALLVEYTNLRIETYELFLKAVGLESTEFDDEIMKRHERIDEIISEL